MAGAAGDRTPRGEPLTVLRATTLADRGIAHGFGLRGSVAPPGLLRPRQVHGCAVAAADACRGDPPPEADVVVSREPGVPVGVVTADCVPLLLAHASGGPVAAVHAGWRGLARGVVAQGVDAVRRNASDARSDRRPDRVRDRVPDRAEERILAAIGPHIGPCCYEVDAPVLEALGAVHGSLDAVLRPSRPGHAFLDLGALARAALLAVGLRPDDVERLPDVCTRCDARRFHSYRRDGPKAGRLVHHIAASDSSQP